MVKVEATAARADFSALLSRVRYGADQVLIQRHSKPVAAMVSVEDLRLLKMLENHLDINAARKALANPKNKVRIPWEKVKKDLGV